MKYYSLVKTAFGSDSWIYKGHECYTEVDVEPDNRKIFHYVKTPDGRSLQPNLDSYDSSRDIVNLWIDLGYPEPDTSGRLTNQKATVGYSAISMQQLQQYAAQRQRQQPM